METKNRITVSTTVNADIDTVWKMWTEPKHIVHWNFAADTWCCPKAENDLRTGGKFNSRMEAKGGRMGFNFNGTYDEIIDQKLIAFTMPDGRKVDIQFFENGEEVTISETFDAEGTNTDEQQRTGWQAILGNFKKYVENS